jgi:hypothetical protein
MHQLTDLPDTIDGLEAAGPGNRRIRTEGTRNLVLASGGAKVIAQSIAFGEVPEEHERIGGGYRPAP